jgi:hypothetical protein
VAAAERSPRRRYIPRRGVVDATGAGLVGVVIAVAVAVAGAWAGSRLGLTPNAGWLFAAPVGIALGVGAVIWRYRRLPAGGFSQQLDDGPPST